MKVFDARPFGNAGLKHPLARGARLVVLLAIGCSNAPSHDKLPVGTDGPDASLPNDGGNSDAATSTPTAAAFVQKLTERTSAAFVNCGFPPMDAAMVARYGVAVDSGRLTYDASYAQACLAELDGVSCGDLLLSWRQATPSCNKALRGGVVVGGACMEWLDCESQVCVFSNGVCPGVCGDSVDDFAADGEDCSTKSCAIGLACVGGRCAPRSGGSGSSCKSLADCVKGFYCAGPYACGSGGGDTCALSDVNTCKPRKARGEPCGAEKDVSVWSVCVEGLLCAGAVIALGGGGSATANSQGTCQPMSDEGGPCQVPVATGTIVVTGCRAGLVCDGSTCRQPPSVGATCATSDDTRCSGGYCDSATNLCTAFLPPGSPASAGCQQCEYACDFETTGNTPLCALPPLWCD
jgi:hypothetical protein